MALSEIAAFIVSLLGISGRAADVVEYFIYDTLKVLLLLATVVFAIALVRTFITRDRIRKLLGGRKEGFGNILAALLGILTPFCSCSAVPIFIGFVESGVPLEVTFSFLIASPMINEIAIALLWGLFGLRVALLYVLSGLVVAIVAGLIIGRLNLESEVESFVYRGHAKRFRETKWTWPERFDFAKGETTRIVGKVWSFILIGIALGAVIHGYAPANWLAGIAGPSNPLAVPIVVVIGIPLYSNSASMIPIVQALLGKGMAIGTALAFMMSVTALSLPEMIILRRVLKPKLLAIFIGVLFVAFVLTGYLFNFLL